MKNNIKIISITLVLFGCSALFSNVKAQLQKSNEIPGVLVKSGDGFGELRKLLKDNFDFTNPDFKEGVVNTNVSFTLSEDGKIKNIHAQGDCKNVSQEITDVLSTLQYTIDMSKLKKSMMATHYEFPVTVMIAQR